MLGKERMLEWDSWKHFPVCYLLCPSFCNSLKKRSFNLRCCLLIIEFSIFLMTEVQGMVLRARGCFLPFIVQCSDKPSLIHKVMLSLQKPFPGGMKEETAFATSQGNTLQEQDLFLLTQLWRCGTEHLSSCMSHNHQRITQGPQREHVITHVPCGGTSVVGS